MKLLERFENAIKKLQIYSQRIWYIPLMGLLIFADLFVIFIPSETLLVKSVMLKPKRAYWIALWLVLCSALGAVALAYCTIQFGPKFLNAIDSSMLESERWLKIKTFVDQYGFWGVSAMSFGPLPQQAAIAIAGLSHMSYTKIFWAVFIGRLPKYFFFAWMGLKAPHLYKKLFKNSDPSD